MIKLFKGITLIYINKMIGPVLFSELDYYVLKALEEGEVTQMTDEEYEKLKVRLKERQRKYYQRYRKENRDKINEYQKKSYQKNKENGNHKNINPLGYYPHSNP